MTSRYPQPGTLIVGGGHIASALLGGVIEAGWSPKSLHVIEPNIEQASKIAARFHVSTSQDFSCVPCEPHVVIWAVKPQTLNEAMAAGRALCRKALNISFAAGIGVASLSKALETPEVVRAMPNMAMSFGKGVTGLLAGDQLSDFNRHWTQEIFTTVGEVLWVQSDSDIDVITAVSGSGPAYIFALLEMFEYAAIGCGIPASHARDLVLQVAEGAVLQSRRSGTSFGNLKSSVTSKNGTTEAALKIFEQHNLSQTFGDALIAARNRAAELATEFGK